MDVLANQVAALVSQVATLTAQVQQTEVRAVASEQRATAAEQNAAVGAAGTAEVGRALQALPAAIAAAAQTHSTSRTLVDPKGLGKPASFDNKEASFLAWSRKTESYVSSVFPTMRRVMTWAAEQDTTVAVDDITLEFGDISGAQAMEFDEQLHAVLMALTTAESFDLVLGSGPGRGSEAWRKLNKRWDPLTAGRARGLLKEILQPKRVRQGEILGALEKLEELFRRYTSRRDGQGQLHQLAEDIRMSSLEALLPEELERHVQLNRARLSTYDALRTEVVMYAETRSGPTGRSGGGPGGSSDMDVDSLWKGGGGGRGKGGAGGGKADHRQRDAGKTCYICGKVGHVATDCWKRQDGGKGGKGAGKGDGGKAAGGGKTGIKCYNCGGEGHIAANCKKPKKPAAPGGGGGGKGDGKTGGRGGGGRGKGGKGKATNALDEEAGGEPEAELQAFDICGVGFAEPEARDAWKKCDGDWLRLTLDTGAAASVFPKEATYGEYIPQKQSGKPPRFRTATGELISADTRRRVRGVGEWGQRVGYSGWDTEVRKPLIAAGEVTDFGSLIVLGKYGGHVIGNEKVKRAVMATLNECLRKDSTSTVPVHKEAGVFNMYLQLDGKDDTKDIGAQDDEMEDTFPEFDLPPLPPRRDFPRQGKQNP